MQTPECFKLIYLARRAAGVSRTDWPRTWRSHAVFASKLPGLETQLEWVRYCNRLDAPTLDGKPVDLPRLSTDHDGVAVVASSTMEGIKGSRFTAEIQALIDEDERRVFDRLTPEFTFFTTERILKPGPLGDATLFMFLRRRDNVTPQDFDDRYCRRHAEIAERVCASIPSLTRAVLNRPIHDPPPLFPFEGISEYWFETTEDAARHLASGDLDEIIQDLSSFCSVARSVQLLTSVIHRWSAD